MKSKTHLINSLIVIILVLLGFILGYSIGNSMIGEYNPPWEHQKLSPAPKGIVSIAHLDIVSTLYEPVGDVVYIADLNGIIYSNTVFESEWSVVDAIPDWENDNFSNCATEWLGEHDYSHLGDVPPVEKAVLDSAGVRFERPISTIARCYLLFEDGSLEVWTHSGDAMGLLTREFFKIAGAVIGLVIGVIISIRVIRFRKRAASLPA